VSPRSYLVQILLPKETGNGQPISHQWFEAILKELTERFGGATSFLRAPGQGLWQSGPKTGRRFTTSATPISPAPRSYGHLCRCCSYHNGGAFGDRCNSDQSGRVAGFTIDDGEIDVCGYRQPAKPGGCDAIPSAVGCPPARSPNDFIRRLGGHPTQDRLPCPN
jgi:hypothetical protein